MNRREGFQEAEPVEVPEVEHEQSSAVATADAGEDFDGLPEWPLTIPLKHKPIEKSKGETLHELTFREPSARDIIRAGGNPCRIEVVDMPGGQVAYYPIIDDAKMMRLMANLTGLLEPQIQRMDPRDYNSCAHRLRRFFLPEQGIW